MGLDHHLVIGKIKIRLAKLVRKNAGRIRYNAKKLGEGNLRDTFAVKLQNRFESLYLREMWIQVKREEQIGVQQAEIELKNSVARSKVPI